MVQNEIERKAFIADWMRAGLFLVALNLIGMFVLCCGLVASVYFLVRCERSERVVNDFRPSVNIEDQTKQLAREMAIQRGWVPDGKKAAE